MKLDTLSVHGYKSIRELKNFEFRNLNVLIGANGAGKSNLISLFRMLAALSRSQLQEFVQKQGGPDALLFGGRKRTQEMTVALSFGRNTYGALLEPTADGRLIFTHEEVGFLTSLDTVHMEAKVDIHSETKLTKTNQAKAKKVDDYVLKALQSWRVYHFHDTSESAAVKQTHPSNDNLRLLPDAGNLAAYIAHLKTEHYPAYERIVGIIRLAAPFFDDFVVRSPLPASVELEWTEKSDEFASPQRAHVLSDGTLRFICLTTLLLQHDYLLPDTIIIDEPELGLHPYAINLLAEMLKQAAVSKQVIISTQSVELLNHFTPDDIVVVEREQRASTFRRLNETDLEHWLEDYTVGELWKSNVLGGRPGFAAGKW